MTKTEIDALAVGDIVAHISDGKAFIVTGNYGDRVTAVRTIDITNPTEWVIKNRANYQPFYD